MRRYRKEVRQKKKIWNRRLQTREIDEDGDATA
jgi:hypothetical protein